MSLLDGATGLDDPGRRVPAWQDATGAWHVTWGADKGADRKRAESNGPMSLRTSTALQLQYGANVLPRRGLEGVAWVRAKQGDAASLEWVTNLACNIAVVEYGDGSDGPGPVFAAAPTPATGEFDVARHVVERVAAATRGSVFSGLGLRPGATAPSWKATSAERRAILKGSVVVEEGATLGEVAGRRVVALAATLTSGATLTQSMAALSALLPQHPHPLQAEGFALFRLVDIHYAHSCSGQLPGRVQDAHEARVRVFRAARVARSAARELSREAP